MCVGLSSDTVPEEWACDSCRLARIADREKASIDGDGAFSTTRTLCVILPSTLSYRMACLKSKTPHTFTRARWVDVPEGFGFDESKWFPTKDCGRCSRALARTFWEDLTEEGSKRAIISPLPRHPLSSYPLRIVGLY
jgi:hypothetical protein